MLGVAGMIDDLTGNTGALREGSLNSEGQRKPDFQYASNEFGSDVGTGMGINEWDFSMVDWSALMPPPVTVDSGQGVYCESAAFLDCHQGLFPQDRGAIDLE